MTCLGEQLLRGGHQCIGLTRASATCTAKAETTALQMSDTGNSLASNLVGFHLLVDRLRICVSSEVPDPGLRGGADPAFSNATIVIGLSWESLT